MRTPRAGAARGTPTTGLQSGNPAANADGRDEAGRKAKERVAAAGRIPAANAASFGLVENVAALFRDNPLEAEGMLRDMAFDMTRSVLAGTFEGLDDPGPSPAAAGLSMHLMSGLTARESEGA